MMALVSVALVLALGECKDHKELTSRSAPVIVGSAMILISRLLMGASINAGQGSKRDEHGSRQGPSASIPRQIRAFLRSSTQGLRNALHNGSEAFLLLISAIITTRHQSIVCDDKLDLISRLLSCHYDFDTFLHTFNSSPPLSIPRSTMPFVVSAWYR